MARTVSRGTRSGRAQRRKLIWARLIIEDVVVGANTAVFNDLLGEFETEYGAQLIGCTVMRIRGWLRPATSLPDDDFLLAGIRVTNESDTLVAADQGPGSDPHADWMYWDVVPSSGAEGLSSGRYFDVKSMRKFDELGQALTLSLQSVSATATTCDVVVSTLIALP